MNDIPLSQILGKHGHMGMAKQAKDLEDRLEKMTGLYTFTYDRLAEVSALNAAHKAEISKLQQVVHKSKTVLSLAKDMADVVEGCEYFYDTMNTGKG
jgi:hypothetical protein